MTLTSKLLMLLTTMSCFNMFAQLHLDFGKTNTDAAYYHFKGGQNTEILARGTFYGIDYNRPTIGLDRNDMHAVSETKVGNGHFLAKFDAHAKYMKHTYFHTGKNSAIYDVVTDSNFFYIFMLVEDSMRVKSNPAYYTNTKQYAILKFNRELEFLKSTYFDYDTTTSWDMNIGGSKILLSTYYNSEVDFTIQGKTVKLAKPKSQFPNNNYDHLLLSFDTELNYENHGAIEGSRNTRIVNTQISSSNQISLILATDRFADLRYGNDTIQRDTNIGFGNNPAVLWLDEDLKLKRFWAERDNKIKSIGYGSFNENGNFAYMLHMEKTINVSYNRIILRDSTGGFITNLDAPSVSSGQLLFTPEAMGDYFAISSGNHSWQFKDTLLHANSLSRILISADSLKLVSITPFGNQYTAGIESQGLNFIFGGLKYSGQVIIDTLNGKMPEYKIGTILQPGKLFYGIYKYTKQCIPVKASIAYDTLTICADQYGMWGNGRGSMTVNYSGSGASFQWYKDPNFVLPLNDMVSPLQGGIRQEGTQTNVMTRTFGYTEYNVNRYLVRVNGACTEPFFVDTIYHQVWGTPQLRPLFSSLVAEVGDTVEIKTYLNDPDYPRDSLTFQWYKGNTALQEGTKYVNTKSEQLTINKVNAFDGVTYSCKVERVHCRELNTHPKMDVFLTVQNTIGLANLEKVPFTVSPNPARNEVKIDLEKPYTGKVNFINALGQTMEVPCVENRISTEQFSPGIYFLSFENNGFYYTSKLIKE